MTNTIGGHNRDALIWALTEFERRNESERFVFRMMAAFTPLFLEMPAAGPCVTAIMNPAKLAEMMAEEGRRCGLSIQSHYDDADYDGESAKDYVLFAGVSSAIMAHRFNWEEPQRLDHAKVRRILLQWLQLPDDAHNEAERVLRGET